MPRNVIKTVFKFEELSERAKETAREWFRRDYPDYDWWDSSYEDFARVADILGINLRQKYVKLMGGGTRAEPEIWFNGFYHQGSGSSFSATYSYAKGATRKIREYAPADEKLHHIADGLQALQRAAFYQLSASVTPTNRETSIRVSVEHETRYATDAEEDAIQELMDDFNNWMYRQLESEYEYLVSDESVDETIICNEYEFDEDGRPA